MSSRKKFDYNSTDYNEFLKDFRQSSSDGNKIIVYVGEFTDYRESAVEDLKREVIGETVEVDLNEVITSNEEESKRNVDKSISELPDDAKLVIFRNANQLSGAYTSYSASKVRYITPQERYFLKKVKEISAPVVIELSHPDQMDRYLERMADVVVLFDPPTSIIERLAWNFKNIRVHGTSFLSPRPVNK